VTDVDTLFERLAHGKSTDETTSKHVSGTVGVNDLVVCELGDGEGLGVRVSGLDVGDSGGWAGRGNEGRVGTLGDDDETGSGRVGFGVVGEGGSGLLKRGVLVCQQNRRVRAVELTPIPAAVA
jgi:hypothetical protein